MEVKKECFKITILGKCLTNKDIIQLYNFGMSKEGIVKKYKKDNKLNINNARKIVENVLFENLVKERSI